MPPVGFEPSISAGERPRTYALDRVVSEIGIIPYMQIINKSYILLLTYGACHRSL